MKSGLPLQEATKEAQEQVVALARSVKHEQRPAYYDEVLGKACLAGACTAPAVADKPATPADDTAADYQAALALNTLQAWDAFLKYHPDGFYADLAQAARKKLGLRGDRKLNLPAAKPPVEDGTRPVKLPPLDALLPAASMSAIDECDRLTAVILDPDKPVTLAGRGTRKPDEGPEAINACRAAVDAHPDVRRFKTQLAFALLPTKRFDEARKLLEEAAAAGHATAMRGIGFGYFYGTSYAKDQAEGVRWFEKAAAAGDPLGYWYLAFAHYFGLAPLAAISPAATEVTECDRLGALVLDADKPAGVRGISRPGSCTTTPWRPAGKRSPTTPRYGASRPISAWHCSRATRRARRWRSSRRRRSRSFDGNVRLRADLRARPGRGDERGRGRSLDREDRSTAGSGPASIGAAYLYMDGVPGRRKGRSEGATGHRAGIAAPGAGDRGRRPGCTGAARPALPRGQGRGGADPAKAAPLFLDGIQTPQLHRHRYAPQPRPAPGGDETRGGATACRHRLFAGSG